MTATRSTTFAVGLITCLFFLWSFALNLNSILIPHLKKACQLTDGQSALIDSASYLAYFLLALPARSQSIATASSRPLNGAIEMLRYAQHDRRLFN